MNALLVVLPLLIAHDPHGSHHSPDVCVCETVIATDGFCEKCHAAYYATLRITSKPLYETLDMHGHDVFADRTRCPACRSLIATGGFCDACHMGFLDGKGYFSRLCYQMAKGRLLDAASDRRPCCEAAGGWCDACHRGIVGNRVFDNRADYDAVRACFIVFQSAVAKSKECEWCAVAMIADGRCQHCKIEYAQGKPVASAPAAKTSGG